MKKITTIALNKEQRKIIKDFHKRYPYIFQSETHFVRCAINYFGRAINKGDFKLEHFEVKQ